MTEQNIEAKEETIEKASEPIAAVPFRPEPKPPGIQYDVPPDGSYMDVDEAVRAIKKLHSDIAADSGHPYMNPSHPLHKDYLKYGAALHEAARADDVNELEVAMAEQEDKEAERLEGLRKDAQKDLEVLQEAGLEPDGGEISEDTPEHKLRLLKMRALNLSDNLQDKILLRNMLRDDLGRVPSSQKLRQMFDTFTMADGMDSELRSGIADQIIFYLDRAYDCGALHLRGKKNQRRFGG